MHLPKRVFLIDDDETTRRSYASIINSTSQFLVVGSFDNCEDAIKSIGKLNPDIILMDIGLPTMNGIDGTRTIYRQDPNIQIIIVTAHDESKIVFEALKAGATGYISKSFNLTELLAALEEIAKGGAPMSSKIARMVVNDFHLNKKSPLTERESFILNKMAQGKSYTQIAAEANISRDTAKSHIKNIYKRLHVNKKSDAIHVGRKEKLIGLF